LKNKRGFFLVLIESLLNKIIFFFDYDYCPVCKKIILRTLEGRRAEEIEGGEKIFFQQKCPLCKKLLKEVHVLNGRIRSIKMKR